MAGEKNQVVIFVEGDTESEFFEALYSYYRTYSTSAIVNCKIYNMRGIGRFESKVPAKLQHEIIPKFSDRKISVVCAYDMDAFSLAPKPPVNWKIVRSKVTQLGITDFIEVKAEKMIEDWFLSDLQGLCKFLKIPTPRKIEGNDGLDKIKKLFKKKDKLYLKGHYTSKFIPDLDLRLIRDKFKKQFLFFEEALNVKLK